MTEHDEKLREAVALFRYGLIADLAHLPRGARGIGEKLREKAAGTYAIPGTHRTRVAAETIRKWLVTYRYGGFEALYPKRRSDLGRPRRMPAEVAEALVAIKTRRPGYSVRAVIAHAAEHGLVSEAAMPSPSTVQRLLRREGLTGRAAAEAPATDRRRFNYRRAGQLWMSDVMHGPKVPEGRRRRKTFLIAFIDDATRVIPHAAFAFAENTAAFLPVFKHALLRRGLTERLYVDNGANYRSRHLALVCAKLGIALIHARPYQPAGKGKIERWFRTLRAGWLRHLDVGSIDGIEALNRALAGWVEGEYHQSPAPRTGRSDPAGPLGRDRRRGALPGRRRAGSGRAVPVRDQTPRAQGPHPESARAPLRGRRDPHRANRHRAIRSGRPAHPGAATGARGTSRGPGHAAGRLRQHRRENASAAAGASSAGSRNRRARR